MQRNLFLINSNIAKCIILENIFELYDLIKLTYVMHGNNQTVNPPSCFLHFPEKPAARIIALPAFIGGTQRISGIKWISSNPMNYQHSLPRASGILILNDYETGFPFACIEASFISTVRTVLSAILAAEFMLDNGRLIHSLGLVGIGMINETIYKLLVHLGWTIETTHLFDTQQNKISAFIADNNTHKLTKVKASTNIEELLKNSDLISFATTESIPYIFDKDFFSHNPNILHISLRDLSAPILLDANNIVDDTEHVLHANTSPHLAFNITKNKNFINGTLCQLIEGKIKLSANKPTIFSPMGLGILDIAIGKYIFDTALRTQQYTLVENFFM